jgi:formylglycine-generating enzyme required for sulfatase activity
MSIPAKQASDPSKRIALLIGNSDYQYSGKLSNPINDVDSMEVALKQVGFEVMKIKNARLSDLDSIIDAFDEAIDRGRFGVALSFFAGHGIQVSGENYLLPVDAHPKSESDVRRHCVPADRLLYAMAEAGASTGILLLDACRNNPLARSFKRSGDVGLASVGSVPKGMFIGYATAPGKVALDGLGLNSPYTTAILRHLHTPGLSIDDVFTQVAASTQELVGQSGASQTPFKVSNLNAIFYFVPPLPKPRSTDEYDEELDAYQLDIEAYDLACHHNNSKAFKAYLKDFPKGAFKAEAEARLKDINNGRREEIAWYRAEKIHTATVYKCYLDSFPSGKFRSIADSVLHAMFPGTMTNPLVGNFILVKGGTFNMGCTQQSDICDDDERPPHSVTLKGYYIGQTEVTQAQWRAVTGDNPAKFNDCEECPVEQVSWDDVQEFLRLLNRRCGGTPFRLPTEAEWEYAARGGHLSQQFSHAGSDDLEEIAWYKHNAEKRTHPVKTKKPNELGLYDMNGNVWEWCGDWFDDYPAKTEVICNPKGPSEGRARVGRGGSWGVDIASCRLVNRGRYAPHSKGPNLGFRLVRDVE